MGKVISLIIGVIMCILLGLICTFFMYINTKKDELWQEIHNRWKNE